MISLDSVEESILELEQKDTSFSNCERLAWLYIVRDHVRGYSASESTKIDLRTNSPFLSEVNGKSPEPMWRIMDEVMDSLKVLHPKMYDAIMEKIKAVG